MSEAKTTKKKESNFFIPDPHGGCGGSPPYLEPAEPVDPRSLIKKRDTHYYSDAGAPVSPITIGPRE